MVHRCGPYSLDPVYHYEVCRVHRTVIVKTLGLGGRKNRVQTLLILLVESGLVYLGFQVSDMLVCARKILKVLTVLIDSVLCFESGWESSWL